MAATTPKPLYHGQPTNAAAVLYTAPGTAGNWTVIRHLRCVNPDTVAHTLDLWRGGHADVNRITETITIPPGGSWEDDVYLPLAVSETIEGKADTSAKITLFIGGAEFA